MKSVNLSAGLCRSQLACLGEHPVGDRVPGPGFQKESFTGASLLHVEFSKRQRFSRFKRSISAARIDEIGIAKAHYGGLAIRFQQDRRTLLHSNAADCGRCWRSSIAVWFVETR